MASPVPPTTATASRPTLPARPDTGPLAVFVAVALGLGGTMVALSTIIEPGEPFLLVAVLGALAAPALVLTYREGGAGAVRALLRDVVRLPRPWWWLPLAGLGLPALMWVAGLAVGGARPLDGRLIAFYLGDLLTGMLVINLWEELAWTGFVQRRAMRRWGETPGGFVTAAFFTGFHVPLAFAGPGDAGRVLANLGIIAAAALGIRLLIGRVDSWAGGSLLTIGLLHSSVNAAESLVVPASDWLRPTLTLAVAVVAVALTPAPAIRRPAVPRPWGRSR